MSWVSVEKRPGGHAVITLAKEPVNSMDAGLWQQIYDKFIECEKDSTVRGVIFQSGLKKSVFTAGLALTELYAPMTSEEKLHAFWTLLSKTLTAIYGSRMVTIAAISGACPAGGCGLSLCCDYRIITADGQMGLNEVMIGIAVPDTWLPWFLDTVGHREGEKLLLTGKMPKTPELLRLGMVDEAGEALLPAAEKVMGQWLKAPDPGRVKTKNAIR